MRSILTCADSRPRARPATPERTDAAPFGNDHRAAFVFQLYALEASYINIIATQARFVVVAFFVPILAGTAFSRQ
jgi:hypothetical protein